MWPSRTITETIRDIRRNIANGAGCILTKSGYRLLTVRATLPGEMPVHEIVGNHHALRCDFSKVRRNSIGMIAKREFSAENGDLVFRRIGMQTKLAQNFLRIERGRQRALALVAISRSPGIAIQILALRRRARLSRNIPRGLETADREPMRRRGRFARRVGVIEEIRKKRFKIRRQRRANAHDTSES